MIVLETGKARAVVAREGAEMKHWEVVGGPLLWEPDPKVWPETAPILFPIVGWTRNGQERVGRQSYPLALHGFARAWCFEILAQSPNVVRLRLSSDAATRALYPFDFILTVEHRLAASRWETILDVANTGSSAMPYACGVHPEFRWPFTQGAPGDHRIRFTAAENPAVPELDRNGLMTRRMRPLPLKGKVLPLFQELLAQDALCRLNAKSRGLRFEAPDGAAIGLAAANLPHLALWCRPGHGYLCLEAWKGHSDPEDFVGDLFEKPSMRILAAGETVRHAASYTFIPPQAPTVTTAGRTTG